MRYYIVEDNKIVLTELGERALKILGVSLVDLKDFPDERLTKDYWTGCKSYLDQAMKTGKGVTWLGNCKIPTNEPEKLTNRKPRADDAVFSDETCGFDSEGVSRATADPAGRFPANLLVSDDVLNDGTVHQTSKAKEDETASGGYWTASTGKPAGPTYSDSGSFSRYFDLDSWAKKHLPLSGYFDNQNARKHYYNQDYFERVDSWEKAYWLGFIVGDGWVSMDGSDYRIQINLAMHDSDHLNGFIQCIDGNENQIRQYSVDLVTLVLGSKKMVHDLVNLGVPVKNKSHVATMPNVSEEFVSGFWLGLFDADGSIGLYDSRSTYNDKMYCYKSIRLSLVSSESLCHGFSNFLGFNGKYVYPKASVYQFGKSLSVDSLLKVYSRLYSGSNVCLRRKQTVFQDILSARLLDVCELPEAVQQTFPFFIVLKPSTKEKNLGCEDLEPDYSRPEEGSVSNRLAILSNLYTEAGDNPSGRGKTPKHHNTHPTIKSIKLMSYLITLGSREGDIVLDPFAGSGTTGCACVLFNRNYLMIDKEPKYVEIAKRRISYWRSSMCQEGQDDASIDDD